MTDREIKNKIGQAMDHALSGLPCDAFLTQRVLQRAQQEKGEEKMVKKISGSLIVALVLVFLLATAALALTNWEELKAYFETVRAMDAEGELARWSDEDKVKLLAAMADAGLVTGQDARVETALDEAQPLKRRAEAADAVITQRYGDDYFNSNAVESLEFPEAQRTQEEQAAYGEWSGAYWAQWNARGKRPLTESRVYLATMNNLTEIGNFPKELLRDVRVSGAWSEEGRLYVVTAAIDKETYLAAKRDVDQLSLFDSGCGGFVDGDSLCFQFWLDEYGAFLGIYNANAPENRAELTLEEAQGLAEKALAVRLNVDKAALSGMTLRAVYTECSEYIQEEGRFRAACTFMWEADGENRYFVDIDAKTGRVIRAFDWRESDAMKEKEIAWIAEVRGRLREAGVSDTLTNEKGQYFFGWTVAEKAAWSRAARPVIQGYLLEHEDFSKYLEDLSALRYAQHEWPNLIALAQYAYGVPDEAALSQERAFAIAREAALARGAKQSYVDDNVNHAFYYDITDPARPLWKLNIHLLFGAMDTEHPYDAIAAWGYFVVIDAHTGEILHVLERTVNTDIREIV